MNHYRMTIMRYNILWLIRGLCATAICIFCFLQLKMHNTSNTSSYGDNNNKNQLLHPTLLLLFDDSKSISTSTSSKLLSTYSDHRREFHYQPTVVINASKSMEDYDVKKMNYTFLWNNTATSSNIPLWMKDYMEWHYRMRKTFLINEETWDNTSKERHPKLLILQCIKSNKKCGGIADRLKPLPLLLLGAYKYKRLLFIRWKDRPCSLEKFMIPPIGGLDWRIPYWLDTKFGENYNGYTKRNIINVKPFMKIMEQSQNVDIVTATMQWWDGGEQAYKDALQLKNSKNNNDEFRRLYHDLFRIMFEPTQPIQAILNNIWETTLLKPNKYAVAHYRALWWETQDPPSLIEQNETAINSIHCASQLQQQSSTPIYFATDSIIAQQFIQQYTINTKRSNIVVIPYKQLVHLDRVTLDNDTTKIEDIYPVFVDLWLLANSNCISVGDGGFGKYGLMISTNYTCTNRHIIRHKIQKC